MRSRQNGGEVLLHRGSIAERVDLSGRLRCDVESDLVVTRVARRQLPARAAASGVEGPGGCSLI